MKKLSSKMVALIAAMMMCLTAEAMTEDVGGRVIDAQGEPLPFVSVALLTADSTYIQGATSDVECLLHSAILVHRLSYQVCECKWLGDWNHPDGGGPGDAE